MAEIMTSYMDFAENDYSFFRQAYDNNNKGSALAALGQNICERYLKHIVSTYANPESNREIREKESALRTHNLNKLMSYISDNMGIEIPEDVELSLNVIDGFYFTTRYPGSESFIPRERDIDKANRAVEKARAFTVEICHELEQCVNFTEEHGEHDDYDDYDDYDR